MTTNAALVSSFVPPERWGALLHRTRVDQGRTLTELSRVLEGWTPQQLADVERGGGAAEAELSSLALAYGLTRYTTRNQPWRLVLDRSTTLVEPRDRVSVSGRAEGLARLGAVLRIARALDPVEREGEWDLVAEWIGTDVHEVRTAMATAPGTLDSTIDAASGDQPEVWARLCVPAIGLLIGTTVSGSLSLVGTPSDGNEPGSTAFPTVVTVGEWARLVSRRISPHEPAAVHG